MCFSCTVGCIWKQRNRVMFGDHGLEVFTGDAVMDQILLKLQTDRRGFRVAYDGCFCLAQHRGAFT